MSNKPEIEICPECDGCGWVIVWGHACNGDERKCQYMCPIQEQAICPTCGSLTLYAPDSLKAGVLSLPESVKVENVLPAVSG
jgi:hypothetical protein